jgi:hypothetical protein
LGKVIESSIFIWASKKPAGTVMSSSPLRIEEEDLTVRASVKESPFFNTSSTATVTMWLYGKVYTFALVTTTLSTPLVVMTSTTSSLVLHRGTPVAPEMMLKIALSVEPLTLASQAPSISILKLSEEGPEIPNGVEYCRCSNWVSQIEIYNHSTIPVPSSVSSIVNSPFKNGLVLKPITPSL